MTTDTKQKDQEQDTSAPVDVSQLSSDERKALMKELLGEDFEVIEELQEKKQARETRKAIRAKAKVLVGEDGDESEHDSELKAEYTAAKKALDAVMEKAHKKAESIVTAGKK